MLQKNDKLKSTMLLAVAAAGGLALSPVALAETTCSAADGYATSLSAYVAEANACVSDAETIRASVEDELARQANTARGALGLDTLNRRASLDQAARVHALDMAARNYAAHQDQEGRDHLYRIRAFERSMLIGSTGAIVLASGADAEASMIFATMGQDVQNAKNIVHEWFTDFGVGVVEANGKTYTVILFAAKEGELDEALPLTLRGSAPLGAEFTNSNRRALGWSLYDEASGDLLARGSMPRLRSVRLDGSDSASLDFVVGERTDTVILRGPLVSAR